MLVLPVSSIVCERGFCLNPDTVEDLIRISIEELEDFDARESVEVSKGKRPRRPNYKSWPNEFFRVQGDCSYYSS